MSPLENIARTADTGTPRRSFRFRGRDLLRSVSGVSRLRECGAKVIREGGVQVRVAFDASGAHAGYAGLSTCGSVWACPVCSARILSGRTDEVDTALRRWLADPSHAVAFLTLTMQHRTGQRLGTLWDGLSAAWRLLGKSYAWKRFRADLGLSASLRVTEVTHGRHGWHVHHHVVLFLDRIPSESDLAWQREEVYRAWADALRDNGFRAVPAAQDLRLLSGSVDQVSEDVAEYVTKNRYNDDAPDELRRAALEATRSDLKSARYKGLTPFGILRVVLDQVEEDGDLSAVEDELALWHEWETASRGRRAHVWSRGARDLFGLGVEATDEELASEEVGTEFDAVVVIATSHFARITAVPGAQYDLLATVESATDATAAFVLARAWLDARGIAWRLPPLPSDGPGVLRPSRRRRGRRRPALSAGAAGGATR